MKSINSKTILVASAKSWIEGDAIRQLEKTARLEGMLAAVGLPDLHPGKGSPVGAVFLSEKIIYPFIVGNDVGCGMGLFTTSLKARKAKRDKWRKKLSAFEAPWQGDARAWLLEKGIDLPEYEQACGTIGGGNHFAELQRVETVYDPSALKNMGVDQKNLLLLVHSGSRGLGDDLLRRHTERFGAGGLLEHSQEAIQYCASHDTALKWAQANRELIAERFLSQLNSDAQSLLDVCHNSVTRVEIEGEIRWLHRKGAVPSNDGPAVIPGSRGTLSYLVCPTGDQKKNLWSLAHGAGRKWNRKSTRQRLKAKYNAKALTQTLLGSTVICENRDLLYEEAPDAYKKIENVIDEMVTAGLIKVIATLRPLITYKMRKEK